MARMLQIDIATNIPLMYMFRMSDLSVIKELSVINEVIIEKQKEVDQSAEQSHDSGVAESENSGTIAGNVKVEKQIIILFKALNAKSATTKESTFVASASTTKGSCNISVIGPVGAHNTISDDGKSTVLRLHQ